MRRAAAFAAVVSATAAFAQAPAPRQKAASTPDPNQIVCIRMLEPGSLTHRRRVCRSRAQWDEQLSAAKQRIQIIQGQPGGSAN